MRTRVYVDAFNLYYRCLRNSASKWLDLRKLSELLLPGQVAAITYFTAIVEPRAEDPGQQQRQQAYLRALRTVPGLEICLGTFLTHPSRMAVVHPPPKTIEVWRTEEKGSDVNLATQLLVDGFQGRYETAVVLSNDSDLKAPIQAVREVLGLPVGVIVPGNEKQIRRSALPADFYRRIRPGVLAASQFPAVLRDGRGVIRKPRSW